MFRLRPFTRAMQPPPMLSRVVSPRAFFAARQASATIRQSEPGGSRLYSSATAQHLQPPEDLTEGERKIFDMIKDGLKPDSLMVRDVSGGCGSMYALDVVSEQFQGLPIIKQHRLVNKVLGEEVKKWHGLQLKTKAP